MGRKDNKARKSPCLACHTRDGRCAALTHRYAARVPTALKVNSVLCLQRKTTSGGGERFRTTTVNVKTTTKTITQSTTTATTSYRGTRHRNFHGVPSINTPPPRFLTAKERASPTPRNNQNHAPQKEYLKKCAPKPKGDRGLCQSNYLCFFHHETDAK